MKSFGVNIWAEFAPEFSWFIIPTIEIGIFEKFIAVTWLCFSITIKTRNTGKINNN